MFKHKIEALVQQKLIARLYVVYVAQTFWSPTMWLSILGLVFWFMLSPLRYGPKHKETILEVWKKEFQMLCHLTDFLAVIDKLISRIGKYTSSCISIYLYFFIFQMRTYLVTTFWLRLSSQYTRQSLKLRTKSFNCL